MTLPHCDRSWQVEAARDGRLEPSALAHFQQHKASCTICQAEQAALDALARELSQVGSQVDEMTLRRMRQRTLAQAHEWMVTPARSMGRPHGWAPPLVACAALAAVVLFALTQRNAYVVKPAVVVEAQENAEWHRRLEDDVERVDLSAGTLLFRVARKGSDPRLLVRVPDGEIEDLGTTFSVTVEGGKTREIIVREGRVLFHRRGAAALHLVAGSTWTAETSSPLEPPAPADHAAAERRLPKSKHASPSGLTELAHGKSTRAGSKQAPEAGILEDAAYLQILALLREGRADEARLAALSYLRAFPRGFRAVEVGRVAALHADDAGSGGQE